jgi:hypothetical protein
MTPDKLPEHRIAVTVFAIARGVDRLDASDIAEYAIRKTLAEAAEVQVGEPADITVQHLRGPVTVRIISAMDTGMAIGNGYLWIEPTEKAFREYDRTRQAEDSE